LGSARNELISGSAVLGSARTGQIPGSAFLNVARHLAFSGTTSGYSGPAPHIPGDVCPKLPDYAT
jgi:hypothetical protein